MKTHHLFLLIVSVVLVSGFLLWPRINTQDAVDELRGTWRGEAGVQAEYQWWMEYTFEADGSYTLITDSTYQETGTYKITERFLDGSILVKKIYNDGKKEYTMTVMTSEDNPNLIVIAGTTLIRQ
jgi:hypothetical protein